MNSVHDLVARVEETCGKEKDFVVTFKYDKRKEAIEKILKRAKTEKSISGIVFELVFENVSFRLYKTGKAIFRDFESKEELRKVLLALLS
ncbi:hypothetical protein GTO27_07960 [Candidatus Bathyarchaeota archaeon]|nr:hypothetical protein [Candidatus Bathyarchaeota archaeon]